MPTPPSKLLKGIPASSGVAIGSAYLIFREELPIPTIKITEEELDSEVRRFERVVEEVTTSLRHLAHDLKKLPHREPYKMLSAHLSLLKDPLLIKGTKEKIRTQRINAEWALRKTWKEIEALFSTIEDEYLRSRVEDVQHIYRRLVHTLLGHSPYPVVPKEAILVSHSLGAEDVLRYSRMGIRGFLCESGSPLSHPSILSRMLEIPMIVGAHGILQELEGGETLILDGDRGEIILHPDPATVEGYQSRLLSVTPKIFSLDQAWRREVFTRDHVSCSILANVDTPEEAQQARALGAQGIGLVRTEFPFLGRSSPPDLEELVEVYTRILEPMAGLPVVFRTLDLGGDKLPRFLEIEKEENPALGVRGIRLTLLYPELLRLQVRAILRASANVDGAIIRLLFPMVSTFTELNSGVRLIEEVAREEGIPPPPIGVMIETPASALIMDILAPAAQFFSIGSNDLIQYTMAMDRTNEAVSYLYAPLHLGVLRILKRIVEEAKSLSRPLEICGEMSADPRFVYVLLGLGIREFSMLPSAIPRMIEFLEKAEFSRAEELTKKLFSLSSAEEREDLLHQEMEKQGLLRKAQD